VNFPEIFFVNPATAYHAQQVDRLCDGVSVVVKGQMVYAVRERCGRQLAVEASVEADIVCTVPDSATPAALGYAQQVTSCCMLTVQCCLLCDGCSCTFLFSCLQNDCYTEVNLVKLCL